MSAIYKILLADDHPMVRDGVRLMLETQSEFKVQVIECKNGQEVLDLVPIISFDLILLDISMPVMTGLEALRILKNEMRVDVPVLMITSHDNKRMVLESNELGASGYVLKNSTADELFSGIKIALQKQKYFSNEVAEILLNNQDTEFQSTFQKLTPREKQILVLITKEKNNHEIAEELEISSRTVEGHRERLLKKLNVTSTVGLVKFAVKTGLDSE